MRKHIKPSTMLATVAVVFALTGTATAAQLITGKQIKNGSITKADLSKGTKRTLKGKTGPRGPQGPAGGSALGRVTQVTSSRTYFDGTSYAQSVAAYCPAGQRAVSGGGVAIAINGLVSSEPTPDHSGWFVVGGSDSYDTDQYVEATVLCAPAGTAVAARASSRAANDAKIASIVKRADRMARAAK